MLLHIFLQVQVTNGITTNWVIEKLIPSFIGAGAALTVFLLTTRRDKKKEEIKKQNDRNDKVVYLRSLIDNIISVTKQLSSNLSSHIDKIRQDTLSFHFMVFVPLTDFVRAVDTLSKEEYYSAFNKFYLEKFDSAKSYQRVISIVDYLHAQFLEVPEILKKAQKSDYDRKLEYKVLIDRSVNMTGNLGFQFSQKMPIGIQVMDTILLNFMQGLTNHADLTYYNNEFAIKMNDCVTNYMLTPNNPIINEISIIRENTMNARQLYDIINKANLIVGTNIEEIKTEVDKSLNELIELRKILV